MRFLLFIGLFAAKICVGLDKAPDILRVCLDNNTSIATVFWKTPSDACNSFTAFYVYSRENGGPWILKDKITSLNTTSSSIFTSDPNNCEFRIVAYTACNGIDSFVSNDVKIDQDKPKDQLLDSVSFDQTTQLLSAGWKSNPSIDTKGYRTYEYSNSVSKFIQDEYSTFCLFPNYDKSNPVNITIAAFDSCNLFSGISKPQQAAYLNGSFDTCSKTVKLNWTPYIGWANTKQNLYLNLNNSGFIKQSTPVTGLTILTITNINLGDKLCYFIQTEETVQKITSSSNTVCFATRKLRTPTTNYLSNVTIENDQNILVTFNLDNFADTDSLWLERSDNSVNNFTTILKLKRDPLLTTYTYKDLNANFNNSYYAYRVKTFDKCSNLSSTSNIGTSILLSKPIFLNDQYTFKWNPYSGWEKGISIQEIETSTDRFTWNTLKNETPGTNKSFIGKILLETDSLCIRIKNTEITNTLNQTSVSLSNVHCIYTISDFYFPGTINPYSNNNVFKIYGNGYDKSRGKLEIYNRWGERVFETNNIETGWDAKINGEYADMGNYVYKASFYDQSNKYYLKTGTILIIK